MRTWVSIALFLATAAMVPAQSRAFSWHDDTAHHFSELRYDGRPVLRYMHKPFDNSTAKTREETFKVFHHVFDPNGEQLVTKGPGGLYTHHRGLFYGFNKITYGDKSCDIWHGTRDGYKSTSASQRHVREIERHAGAQGGGHTVQINWHGPDGKVFAEEERSLTVVPLSGGIQIDFRSTLTNKTDQNIKLDGDPQHAGFHFRAAQEVADKTKEKTYYLRPDGKGKPGDTRNWDAKNRGPVNLPWNAMSFVLGDKRLTALYLDHPANPKEARISERDYGRFGTYFEYELTKSTPLDVRYRLWLQFGEMTVEECQTKSRRFVEGKP